MDPKYKIFFEYAKYINKIEPIDPDINELIRQIKMSQNKNMKRGPKNFTVVVTYRDPKDLKVCEHVLAKPDDECNKILLDKCFEELRRKRGIDSSVEEMKCKLPNYQKNVNTLSEYGSAVMNLTKEFQIYQLKVSSDIWQDQSHVNVKTPYWFYLTFQDPENNAGCYEKNPTKIIVQVFENKIGIHLELSKKDAEGRGVVYEKAVKNYHEYLNYFDENMNRKDMNGKNITENTTIKDINPRLAFIRNDVYLKNNGIDSGLNTAKEVKQWLEQAITDAEGNPQRVDIGVEINKDDVCDEEIKKAIEILLPYYKFAVGYIPPAEQKVVDAVKIVKEVKSVILYGPPGTGKTRMSKKIAEQIISREEGTPAYVDQVKLIQFHPGYSYNDFIETITVDPKNPYKDKIFKEFSDKARKNPDKNFVLIIDEINRANVSEVLGEQLYTLEYREQTVSLSISGDDFMLPSNCYVIGTMNTADRSLQSLDYAVRRRFSFIEVADEEPVRYDRKVTIGDSESIKYFCKELYETVKEDVENSVARGVVAKDLVPGISYYIIKCKEEKDKVIPDIDHVKYRIRYELIPLLQEYSKNGIFTEKKTLQKKNNKSLKDMLRGTGEEYFNAIWKEESTEAEDFGYFISV